MNTEEFVRRYAESGNLGCFGGYPGPMLMTDEIIAFSCDGQESNGKYTKLNFYDHAKLKSEIKKFETTTFEHEDIEDEAAYELLDSCMLDISELTIKGGKS